MIGVVKVQPWSTNASGPTDYGIALMDFMASAEYDPYSMTVVRELEESLSSDESLVAGEMVRGYTEKEAVCRLRMGLSENSGR